MGMKRNTPGRKQVLDLNNPTSESQSWKSKYEQICASHVNGLEGSPKEEESEDTEKVKRHTVLAGLSGYLSTDGSSEESDLEEEVAAFMKEVDAIYTIPGLKPQNLKPIVTPAGKAPDTLLMQNSLLKSAAPTSAWQECYDSKTGCTYYWNMTSNQVTWDMPQDYKDYMEALKQWQHQQAHGVAAMIQKARVQQYQQQQQEQMSKLQEDSAKQNLLYRRGLKRLKTNKNKKSRSQSESEDEKIELITSYGPNSGDESSSDQEGKGDKSKQKHKSSTKTSKEESIHAPRIPSVVKKVSHNSKSSREDTIDSRSKKRHYDDKSKSDRSSKSKSRDSSDFLRERIKIHAKVLKRNDEEIKTSIKTETTGSLVPFYGGDSDDEDEEESDDKGNKSIPKKKKNIEPKVSTFLENVAKTESEPKQNENQDSGLKRKIKLELTSSSSKEPITPSEKDKFKGLGYNSLEPDKRPKVEKIQFIKGDVLNEKKSEEEQEPESKDKSDNNKTQFDIIDVSSLLKDKMKFLSMAKEPVPAVEMWNIQLETLLAAWESDDLSRAYIEKWLKNISSELERLETSAAPDGWLCQWQRKEKCYSYTNEVTGKVVWEFPQADDEKHGGEEDMEVCTPPPLSPEAVILSPPPPPQISPPTPPPAPIIASEDLPPVPPLPPPPKEQPAPPPPPPPPEEPRFRQIDQPLPPGVDATDVLVPIIPQEFTIQLQTPLTPIYTIPYQTGIIPLKRENPQDLSSELNNFYSDLASLEPEPSSPLPAIIKEDSLPSPPTSISSLPDTSESSAKKKKKPKLAPGLTLKKKNVSSLVAKWQQVQADVRRDLKNIEE